MSETLYGLTASQVARLKRLLDGVESADRPPVSNSVRFPKNSTKIFVGILTSSVAATTALTGKPSVGTLNVYDVSSTGTLDTGVDLSVYNLAPHAATTDRWTIAELTATGRIVITTQFCS